MKSQKKKRKKKKIKTRNFQNSKISELNQCQRQTISGSTECQSQIMPESS